MSWFGLVQMVLSACLAAILARAAWHKWRSGLRFVAQFQAYRLLPDGVAPLAAKLLMLFEIASAVLLLSPARSIGAVAALALFAVYTIAIGINLYRGATEIDCGCGDTPQPISGWLLLRNAVLMVACLVIAGVGALPFEWAVLWALPMALVFLLLYEMAEQLLANRTPVRNPS